MINRDVMRTAIVILNWNGENMLRQYLPIVLEHSAADADVWVADNASTDGSMQLLAENFPTVKTLVLDSNYGFADGYNRALTQIKAEYYVLLNSDVEVTPGWLKPLVAYMDSHGDVAACQPKLRAVADKNSFEYAGAAGGFLDRYGYPFCRGRIFDTVEKDQGQYNAEMDVLWATGACFLIRSADYWNVGGLDSRFFAHNEEIDLCWRIRQLGRRVVCLPQSVVYHVGGGTLPKSNPMKTFLNFRNNLTMLYKNLPDDELRHVMRVRFFLDWIAALQMLILKRNMGDFMAVVRARKAFKKWRHDFDEDRSRIAASRQQSVPERKSYSILWQYYVKGRKIFSVLR